MNREKINQMFEGRWRIKADNHPEAWVKGVKAICRDFFEAGIELGKDELPAKQNEVCELPTCRIKESDILTVDDTFNKWWTLYDKKRGREKCMLKWLKMTATEHFACISATPAYVASTPDKKYRKDPLTYLNGKCWNDEIINSNGTENKPTIEQQRKEKLSSILTD